MNERQIEELLERLARQGDDGEPAPPDEALEALRQGELQADQERELLRWLAASRAGRQRLAALAGLEPSRTPEMPAAASDPIRGRVLEAAKALGERPTAPPPKVSKRPRWLELVAAAVLVLILSTPYFRAPDGVPEDVAYEVRVSGLADSRTGGESVAAETPVRALPTTRVRLVAEAVEGASAELAVGLYRVEADRVVRLPPGPEPGALQVEEGRGATVFSAPAELLVGPRPGVHPVLIVVALRGDLPRAVRRPSEADPTEVLAQEGRRLVFTSLIEIVAPAPGDPVP